MKNEGKLLLILMIVVSASLGAMGQLLFKYSIGAKLLPLYLLAGLVVYAVSMAIYFVVLSRSHLSWTYGLGGISYVIAVFLALIFLQEKITVIRWAGVVIIAVGAALIGFS